MAISEEYRNQLTELHKKVDSFGKRSKIPIEFKNLLDSHKFKSILDFGAGKGNVSKTLAASYPNTTIYSYDPATFEYPLPAKVDVIYSSDVLEHIEIDQLDSTLTDLFDRAEYYQYHLIACHPAKKKLSDGRNAHLIIEDPAWWRAKFDRFDQWLIVYEKIIEYTATVKKGAPIPVVKYVVLMKRL